jgi:hypothetical protein
MGANLDFSGSGELRGGSWLLRALLQANSEQLLGTLADIGRNEQLHLIQDEFERASMNMSPMQLAGMLRSGSIPGALSMPRPEDMLRAAFAAMYAPPQSFGLTGNSPFERYLKENPHERGLLEMALGGRIMSAENGTLRVQPFAVGGFGGGANANDSAFIAQNMLASMMRAATSRDGADLAANNMFHGLLMNAMANVLSGQNADRADGADPRDPNGFSSLRAQGHSPFVDWNEDSPEMRRRRQQRGQKGFLGAMPNMLGGAQSSGAGAPFGDPNAAAFMGPSNDSTFQSFSPTGTGDSPFGSLSPAANQFRAFPFPNLGFQSPIQNTFGLGGGGDISGVLADGSLTVEDKICLMLMMIMKKMDQDIENQANYINALQQAQNAAGKGGGGKGGGVPGAPSIDVETMKLKRLIDKRSQMFDMLRQIIDKYNQTAKGIIDSIAR